MPGKGWTQFFKQALKPGGLERYNQALAERATARQHLARGAVLEPLGAWDDALEPEMRLLRPPRLSALAQAAELGPLRRVQRAGQTAPRGNVGWHFDAHDGRQVLDIFQTNKLPHQPAYEPELLTATLAADAPVLLVNDSLINNPQAPWWAKRVTGGEVLGKGDEGRLVDILQRQGLLGMLYGNTHEGVGTSGVRSWTDLIGKRGPFGELRSQVRNPSLSVLDPLSLDDLSVGRRRGGLVALNQ